MIVALILISVAVMAYPWQKPGFTTIYSYESRSYGILALKVKSIKGTISFVFINITDGKIYYKVIMNITAFLGNKLHKKLVNEILLNVPFNASTIFITNETLKGMKKTGKLTCNGSMCVYTTSKELKVQRSMVLLTKVKEIIDLKNMLAKEVIAKAYLKTAKGLVLGRSVTTLKLVKVMVKGPS